jgi:hypothetical protein
MAEIQEQLEDIAVPFSVQIMPSALAELKAIKGYYRRQIVQVIDEQLPHQPLVQTKNRKVLENVPATFEHEPRTWYEDRHCRRIPSPPG